MQCNKTYVVQSNLCSAPFRSIPFRIKLTTCVVKTITAFCFVRSEPNRHSFSDPRKWSRHDTRHDKVVNPGYTGVYTQVLLNLPHPGPTHVRRATVGLPMWWWTISVSFGKKCLYFTSSSYVTMQWMMLIWEALKLPQASACFLYLYLLPTIRLPTKCG